jgi:hypothetical protein
MVPLASIIQPQKRDRCAACPPLATSAHVTISTSLRPKGKAMAAKEKKTGAELTALIMQEVRKHPDCFDITNVAIIRPAQQSPQQPNWGFAWTRDYTNTLRPVRADELARQFQNQFDLA